MPTAGARALVIAVTLLGATRQIVIDGLNCSEEADVAVRSECIEAVVDEVERRGGIGDTSICMQVARSQIDALRAAASAR